MDQEHVVFQTGACKEAWVGAKAIGLLSIHWFCIVFMWCLQLHI